MRTVSIPASASPFVEIIQGFLVPLDRPARSSMDAFLAFGHAAREIARDANLLVERRQEMFDALDALLANRKPTIPLALPLSGSAREAAIALGESSIYGRHLLQALRQDCVKAGYRDWAEWLLFARFAAAPFGQLWIDVADEPPAAVPAAEALACALLLCQCLQDMADDWRIRRKVYLPERWLREHGATPDGLSAAKIDAAWRGVLGEAARAIEQLLVAADPLPRLLRKELTRAAAAEGLCLTRRWAARVVNGDPLAGPIRLKALDRLRGGLAGLWARFR